VDLQRIGHPGGFRRPAHSVSMDDNETAAVLLEPAEEGAKWAPWCRCLQGLRAFRIRFPF
jgi:hypothetical protein